MAIAVRVMLASLLFAVAADAFSPDGNKAMLAICDEKDPAQQWVLRANWVRLIACLLCSI
jgi:hypothetical protein